MRRRLLFLVLVAVLLVAMLPATVAAAPSAGGCPWYYRVQRGDTLFKIATRYGVNMYDIARANGISNINVIYVGTVLTIPCGYVPAPSPSCTHVVQRGEWLSVIARRYGVSLWAIASANGISNPNWIYPGQRLRIPGCTPPPPPAPTPPTPPPTPPWPPWPGPSPAPACPIMPVLGFGRVWNEHSTVRNKLGCPTAAEFSVVGAEQYFQNAIVIWRADQDPVTVLYRNGSWGTLPDPWPDCSCHTPLIPHVGWPSSGRWEGMVAVQEFSGGIMLWTSCCGFYVLYSDGTWTHYN